MAATLAPIARARRAVPGRRHPAVRRRRPSGLRWRRCWLLALLAGREQRLLRTGAAAVRAAADRGLSSCRARWAATPHASGALLGGPLAALILLRRRAARHFARGRLWLLVALAAVAGLLAGASAAGRLPRGRRTTRRCNASFYAPLLAELRRLDVGYGAARRASRSCPTAAHWEARWVAPARDDRPRLGAPARPRAQRGLLRRPALNAAELHAWLLEQGVSLVALPDATLDYSGRAEARLLRARAAALPARSLALAPLAPVRASPIRAPLLSSARRSWRASRPTARACCFRARGATCCGFASRPYWELSSAGAAAWNGHPGAGRGCSRAAPGRFELGIGFSLGRVLGARASLHLTID